MAMWFVHLEVASRSCDVLPEGVQRSELAWGALVCDVDKVSSVARSSSHFSSLARPLVARDFLESLGLGGRAALPARSFLAGVASHLAVDDVWYLHLLARSREQGPAPGWGADSLRALNLLLDMKLRARQQLDWFELAPSPGEALLPFLGDGARAAVHAAAAAYLAWDGRLDPPPTHPGLQPWVGWLVALLAQEQGRVEPLLAAVDVDVLLDELVAASVAAAAGVLAELEA